MLISDFYREMNRQLHAAPRGFGQSGRKHAEAVLRWRAATGCDTLIDYGCGAGTLQAAMRDLGWRGKMQQYDPAVAYREKLPAPADLVVCTDVLEHVEPECLEAVLRHQFGLALRAGYFSISCQPAHKTLPDGRNAHLIVESPDFWMAALRAAGWRIVTRLDRFNDDGLKDCTFELRVPAP